MRTVRKTHIRKMEGHPMTLCGATHLNSNFGAPDEIDCVFCARINESGKIPKKVDTNQVVLERKLRQGNLDIFRCEYAGCGLLYRDIKDKRAYGQQLRLFPNEACFIRRCRKHKYSAGAFND